MTTEETTEQVERRERALVTLRRMVADKREDERRAIEAYKNNPELQELVARLDRENAERGTPLVDHAFNNENK